MKICQRCRNKFDHEDWRCPNCGSEPESENGFKTFSATSNYVDGGFRPELFEELLLLESKNFWFKARNQLICWALEKYFPGKDSFLEIGCGTGFVLAEIEAQFTGMTISGGEVHIAGLGIARRRLETTNLWQMDARNIPFENEFDVIGAFDVLEHIGEDEQVLDQMYQAVSPGGGIILTVPQHPFLWSHTDEHACHERRYIKDELTRKAQKAGFIIDRTTSFVSFLLPFMMASRCINHSTLSEFDPLAELKLNRALNWVFERVLRVEAAMIRIGISLPFGGSLMLIAHKPN